jgi:mono/diheme cytochrome c family protein
MSKRKATVHTMALAITGMAAAILITFAMVTATSSPAAANAAIAKKTGQPCAKCHTSAPTLNSYGKKYKAGHK